MSEVASWSVGQEADVDAIDDHNKEVKTVTPCNGCHMMLAGPMLCAKAIQDTLPVESEYSGTLAKKVENDVRMKKFWGAAALACKSVVAGGGRPPVHQIIKGEYKKV